jgi:hypothetical protein
VVLLVRRPALGRVKTRLGRRIGAPAALRLHLAFLLDTLGWLSALRRSGWSVRLEWSRPFKPGRALGRRLRGIVQSTQAGGSLGRRIEMALRRALNAGAACAVAIGADSPHLGAAPLELARRRLRRCEVVLGPAEDGGYYLIGARSVRRSWFDGIAWGGSRVLRQTLDRLRRDRVRVWRLRASYDLDTIDSLRRLWSALPRSPSLRRSLPRTRRILRELFATASRTNT